MRVARGGRLWAGGWTDAGVPAAGSAGRCRVVPAALLLPPAAASSCCCCCSLQALAAARLASLGARRETSAHLPFTTHHTTTTTAQSEIHTLPRVGRWACPLCCLTLRRHPLQASCVGVRAGCWRPVSSSLSAGPSRPMDGK